MANKDIDIIKTVCSTFNVSLFSSLSDKTKLLISTFITTNVNLRFGGSNAQKALLQMLYNYIFPIFQPKTQFIEGPVALTEFYSEKYLMRVYVFGEVHVKERLCDLSSNQINNIRIDNYLYETCKYSSKFIDLFIERGYFKSSKGVPSLGSSSYFIDYISHKFGLCRSPLKENKCPIPNLRLHLSDTRDYEAYGNKKEIIDYIKLAETSNVFSIILKIIVKNLTDNDMAEIRKIINDTYLGYRFLGNYLYDYKGLILHFVDYFEGLYSFLSKDINSFIIKLFEEAKINKQLNNIKYEEVRDILLGWYRQKIVGIIKAKPNLANLRLFIEELKELANGTNKNSYMMRHSDGREVKVQIDPDLINYIADIRDILAFSVPLFDLYLMARVFRTFTLIQGQYSLSPKNIIIYSGNSHANNQRELFKLLGFEVLFHKEDKINEDEISNQCLDVSELKQPLFT
jgi:hypothetical protein